MTCLNPLWIYLPKFLPKDKPHEEILKILRKPSFHYSKTHYARMIPCNQCIGCKLDHANEWATRCYMEMKTSKTGCFITLTYNNGYSTIKGHENDLSLPINDKSEMTLKPKDLQDFWKRLRKKYPNLKIKYTASGEYGPKNGRPHYHAVVFGWKPDDLEIYKPDYMNRGKTLYKSKTLQKIWGLGFVTVGELNYETACYTARYTQKKAMEETHKIKFRKFEPISNIQYNMEEIEEIVKEWLKIQNIKTEEEKLFYKETAINLFTKLNTKKKQIKPKTTKIPEFISSSQKIGLEYWGLNKERIKRENGILLTIKKKPKLNKIPKYFKKQWEEENWEEYWNWKFKQEQKGKELYLQAVKSLKYPKETPLWKQEIIFTDYQKELMRRKMQLLKRSNIK